MYIVGLFPLFISTLISNIWFKTEKRAKVSDKLIIFT